MDTAPKAAEYKCLRFRLIVGGRAFEVSRGRNGKKKGRNELYLCIWRRKKNLLL